MGVGAGVVVLEASCVLSTRTRLARAAASKTTTTAASFWCTQGARERAYHGLNEACYPRR